MFLPASVCSVLEKNSDVVDEFLKDALCGQQLGQRMGLQKALRFGDPYQICAEGSY